MKKQSQARFNRRQTLGLMAGMPLLVAAGSVRAADRDLTFDDLYGKISVLGLEFSDKVKQFNGKEIAMRGFMAPPLKAEAAFFVLTKVPMSICPFCSTDADWPDDIVVVYLGEKQTFTQPSQTIEVRGKLEMGSWTDPDTGFVSLLRIRQAEYATV